MAEAVFLQNGRTVLKSGFEQITVSLLYGYVQSFYIGAEKYTHFFNKDFKDSDEVAKKYSAGYYNEQEFLDYLVDRTINISTVSKFDSFTDADDNDIISVEILTADFNTISGNDIYGPLYKNYNFTVKDFRDYNIGTEKLKLSESWITGTSGFSWEYSIASDFFNMNLSFILDLEDHQQKLEATIALTLSAVRIGKISVDIFSLFPLNSYFINEQETYWRTVPVFAIGATQIDFLNYFKGLENFYRAAYRNRSLIIDSEPDEKLFLIVSVLHQSVFAILPMTQRLELIKMYVFKGDIEDDGTETCDAVAVIKLLNSIDISNQNFVNQILDTLISNTIETGNLSPPYAQSWLEVLYTNIEDEEPKNNRLRFVTAILFLWAESKYNPYKNLVNGEINYQEFDNLYSYYGQGKVPIINYISEKDIFGIYRDNFWFEFDPWGEGIYWINENQDTYYLRSSETYHFYQPITVLKYPSENDTSIALPKLSGEFSGGIPIFFLKYIDQRGDIEDFSKAVGIFVDVATTFSGIGNLAKLRHLRHLSRLGQIAVVIESVEIISGVVSMILNFVDGCSNSAFCSKLKTVLFYIEIVSLVSDPIAAAKARKAAREVVEEGNINGWPSEMLDEFGGTTPKEQIESLADLDDAAFLLRLRNEIKERVLNRVSRDSNNFTLSYTDSQVDTLIDTGFENGLAADEIEGLIFTGSRNQKPISFSDLNERIINWGTVVKGRKYPYKFNNIGEFDIFCNKLKDQLQDWDIPIDDVRIQGSSLSTPSAKDVDIAIMINENQLASIKESIIARYRKNYINSEGEFLEMDFREAVELLDKQISKGIIKSRQFGLIQNESFMTELYRIRQTYPGGQPLDISIVIKERNFDTPPYLKI